MSSLPTTRYTKYQFFFASCVFLCTPCVLSLTGNSSIIHACSNGTIIHVEWWSNSPYVFKHDERMQGLTLKMFESGVQFCCKPGVQISYNFVHEDFSSVAGKLNKITNRVLMSLNRAAFVVGPTSFGRPFVNLFESPGVAVVSVQNVPGAELLIAILDSWPVLIFILITISLSGICIWALDFKTNPKHFPAFFPFGVWEGCWWAAVTMTTVGYGDKVPKSVAGRLFAVLWINAGLIILAMFMGIVTASLTSSGLGKVNHLYGLEVATINGSAEYHLAITQSAYVHAHRNYKDVYSSIASGGSKLALVDLYTTTKHQHYFQRYNLGVAKVIQQALVHGVVLPQGAQTFQKCLQDYSNSHLEESYSYTARYLTYVPNKEISDGTGYFRGSMFGYSVYVMTGIFIILMGTGLWWQHYWLKRRGEWKEEHDSGLKDFELSTMGFSDCPGLHHVSHMRNVITVNRRPERVPAQQSIDQLIDEYRTYEKTWTRRFKFLRDKHRREQIEVFNLDNTG